MVFGDFGFDEPRNRKGFGKKEREALLAVQNGRCMYCGIKLEIQQVDIDHKTPFSRGGSDNLSNLQALCRTCNGRKGDMTDGEFRKAYKLPGAKSAAGKKPPAKRIPYSYFEKISKERTKQKQATRRRQNQEYDDGWGFW